MRMHVNLGLMSGLPVVVAIDRPSRAKATAKTVPPWEIGRPRGLPAGMLHSRAL